MERRAPERRPITPTDKKFLEFYLWRIRSRKTERPAPYGDPEGVSKVVYEYYEDPRGTPVKRTIEIAEGYLNEGMTMQEVGAKFGITGSRVRQIIDRVGRVLREKRAVADGEMHTNKEFRESLALSHGVLRKLVFWHGRWIEEEWRRVDPPS